MRTTIDIEDDVLLAVKEIARQRKVSIGRVISELTRHALAKQDTLAVRNDIPLFPIQPNARVVTPELVNRLRDEEG
jgi:hypothetical protein